MRRIMVIVAATLYSALAGAQQPQEISLKQAIQLTLANHPSSTIARNNAAIADKKIIESRSSFLPSVTAYTNVDYNIKLQTSVIPAGAFSDEETKLQMGNKFSSGASVEADLNLIDRASRLNIQSAKVDKQIADLQVDKENETLIYNTATSYYQVLSLTEKKKLLNENEKQNQQLLAILKLRYEQGVAKKSEYDRTRVNLNNIQSELALNESNYQLALNKLKNAMGIELESQIKIKDSVAHSIPAAMPTLVELNTPDLLSNQIDQKDLQLKQLEVKKKQASFLPTLSLYGRYGANAFGSELSSAFSNWFDYSTIGVKLSVPIFSGFKKSSQLAQSKLSAENQRLTFRLNNDTYKLDYQNSITQLLTSYNSLKNNRENLTLAKEVTEATTVEYQEGTADLSTLMDADASYREAQTNYTTSLLDFLNAQLAYEKSKGTLTTYINNL